jgi:hypothetical protein
MYNKVQHAEACTAMSSGRLKKKNVCRRIGSMPWRMPASVSASCQSGERYVNFLRNNPVLAGSSLSREDQSTRSMSEHTCVTLCPRENVLFAFDFAEIRWDVDIRDMNKHACVQNKKQSYRV